MWPDNKKSLEQVGSYFPGDICESVSDTASGSPESAKLIS